MVEQTEYIPYGVMSHHEGAVPSRHQFTGQHQDLTTGLILFPGRAYDPELGRFLQPDPFVQDPGDPQTLNRYAYCRNNPINLVDPSGFGWLRKLIAAFVAVTVAVIVTVAVTILTENPYLGVSAGIAAGLWTYQVIAGSGKNQASIAALQQNASPRAPPIPGIAGSQGASTSQAPEFNADQATSFETFSPTMLFPRELSGFIIVRQFPLVTFNNTAYLRIPTEVDLLRNRIISIDQEIGRIYGLQRDMGLMKTGHFVQEALESREKSADEILADHYSTKSILLGEINKRAEESFDNAVEKRLLQLNRQKATLEEQLRVKQR